MYVVKNRIWWPKKCHSHLGKKSKWQNIELKLKSGHKMSNIKMTIGC